VRIANFDCSYFFIFAVNTLIIKITSEVEMLFCQPQRKRDQGASSRFAGFFGPTRSRKSTKGRWRDENCANLANISGFSAYRGCQSAL
jgi:hypothetical protein